MTNGIKPGAPLPPSPVPKNDSMRRLQIGIAGVLTVLLLVGMAGLIGDRARENAVQDAVATQQTPMPGDAPKASSAPLEELGVQPVSKDENLTSDVKTPQAAPPASSVPDLEPDPALAQARRSKQ